MSDNSPDLSVDSGMSEPDIQTTESATGHSSSGRLTIELDPQTLYRLQSLAKWSKWAGIVTIVIGIFWVLTIFGFALPIVILGILLLIMGTRLTAMASHLEFGLQQEEASHVLTALDQLKTYMTLTFILGLLWIVFMAGILIIALLFGSALHEFLRDSGYDYSSTVVETITAWIFH